MNLINESENLQDLLTAGEVSLEEILRMSGLEEASLEDIREHVQGEILEEQIKELEDYEQ